MQSSLLRVRGIFRTGLRELDTYMIHLPLPAAQDLLGAPGQVTQVVLFLARDSDSPLVARHLREQLTAVPTEVLTWRESLVRLAQIFWLEGAFNYAISGILLVMVGLGVLNTILMAVLERRYEFGVCTALGLRPGQLAGLIMCESLLLTLSGLALGLALGLGVHYYLATSGLDLRRFFAADLPTTWTVFDPILYPRLSMRRIAWSAGIVCMMALAFSLYPACKAARTALPEALKAG
jgi:ABC-type lipoprotein release transport system permease subunit